MHYALYRKYRPADFDSVIGQDAVTETLRNQVITGRISHSYLFTGTRGTGKTSFAKIFARAVNCEHPVNGNPCNECPTCKGILDGSIYAVNEMDAASNNSVSDIRAIIDEVIFPPLGAKYKVYIIDEVHMLSPGAFNALLKTIEEPPAHAVFILATTEIQKVPATIRSRCQRFDLSRVPKELLVKHLQSIVQKEGKALPIDVLDTVATLGDGSVRDSLSVMEKVIDVTDPDRIKEILGVCDEKEFFRLSDAIVRQDTDTVCSVMNDFYSSSKEFTLLCTDLSDFYRKLLVARIVRNPSAALGIPKEEAEKYAAEGKRYTAEHILYIMDRLRDNYALLRQSINKRADTEICLLRCALPELGGDYDTLAARMGELEKKAASGFPRPASSPEEKPAVQAPPTPAPPQEEEKPIPPSSPVMTVPKPQSSSPPCAEFEKPAPAAPVSPEKKEEMPIPKKEEIPVSPRVGAEGKNGYKEFIGFEDVIREFAGSDFMLSKNLQKNCKALIKDDTILLIFTNQDDKNDAAGNDGPRKIRTALDNLHMQSTKFNMIVGNASDYLTEKDSEQVLGDSSLFAE